MRAQKEGVRTEQDRVACLEDKVRKLEIKRNKKECRTCVRQHEASVQHYNTLVLLVMRSAMPKDLKHAESPGPSQLARSRR